MRLALDSLRRFSQFLRSRPAAAPRARTRVRPARLQVEGLEQRAVPAAVGALDPTFATGGVAQVASAGLGTAFDAAAAAVQPDGKIVLAGNAIIGGNENAVVARLMPEGKSLDTSFATNGFFALTSVQGNATAVAMDGSKVVVGGSFFNGSGTAFNATDYFVMRLTGGGALDPTFGPLLAGGTRAGLSALDSGHNDQAGALIIDPNGEYLLAGTSLNVVKSNVTGDMALARFNSLGIPDGSFGNTGVAGLFKLDVSGSASNDTATGVAAWQGGYLLAGSTGTPGNPTSAVVARVTATGNGLDTSFGPGGIATTTVFGDDVQVNAIAVQSARPNGPSFDTAVIVGTHSNLSARPFVEELNPDNGGFFGPTAIPVPNTGHAFSAAFDPSGNIIVAGDAISAAGDSDVLVARFLSNGTPDPSFGQNGVVIQNLGFPDDGAAAVVIPDANTILVAGVANQSMMAARFVAAIPPLAIHAPKSAHPHLGTVSFRANHIALADLDPRATVSVRVNTTAGKIHLGTAGVRVSHNNSRTVFVTGSLAAVNRALAQGKLTLATRSHGRATLSLLASDGSNVARATIRVA